jgi:hypothetical protein
VPLDLPCSQHRESEHTTQSYFETKETDDSSSLDAFFDLVGMFSESFVRQSNDHAIQQYTAILQITKLHKNDNAQ